MKIKKEFTYIYKLIDPITDMVMYVGKSDNPTVRFSNHMCGFYDSYKGETSKNIWIKSLKEQGLKPKLEVIEIVPYKDWCEKEKYWIKYYRDINPNLTNITDGGIPTKHMIKVFRTYHTYSNKKLWDIIECGLYENIGWYVTIPITEMDIGIISIFPKDKIAMTINLLFIIRAIEDWNECCIFDEKKPVQISFNKYLYFFATDSTEESEKELQVWVEYLVNMGYVSEYKNINGYKQLMFLYPSDLAWNGDIVKKITLQDLNCYYWHKDPIGILGI